MKIVQVVNALPALQKLATQDISIKKLYKISKLLGNLEDEIAFYNDQREKILGKYCDVVNNQYVPKKENEEDIHRELNELFETEIECEVQEVVIGDNENIKLSYNDLVLLRGFIRIEGDD